MGARPSSFTRSNSSQANPKPVKRTRVKRLGPLTSGDKTLVEDVVAQAAGGLSQRELNALAVVLRRSRDKVKEAVAEASLKLADRAERYADIHMQVTEEALSNGDAKSLEVAARASQWALENINVDGVQVVEKKPDKPTGPSVFVGINVGGKNEPQVEIVEGAKVDIV